MAVADLHDLELGLGHGPLLDAIEDRLELRQPRLRRGIFRISLPGRFSDQIADLPPHRRLGDEIDVGVGIGLPASAFKQPSRLTAAGVVAGARHRLTKRHAFTVLAVFGQRAVREALLVAQLDAAEIEHAVLHGGEHLLTASGALALIERADDPERKMEAGARVADLRAGDELRPLAETRRRGGAAGALRDVLIDLAVLVWAGAEALHRGDDHARVQLMDVVPSEPHAIERAGCKVLDEHITGLDQRVEDALALRMLAVDGDRALVVVEHREVERVSTLHVDELAARDVADARALDLDHIGAEPGEQLRAGRTRLHMREVENLHAGERLAVLAPGLGRSLRQTVAVGFLRR